MDFGIRQVRSAAERLQNVARRTPILTSRQLDERTGLSVYCKAESFQRTGSFKFRGAYNAIAQLDDEQRSRGVVTNSSGNHAQAVALAAALCGTKACIVMPEDAPGSKVNATRGYGAEIVRYDRYTEDRAAIAEALASDRGWVLIPPFDHLDVIAGQGTVALELLEQTPAIDTFIAPVGGGGLMAGCSTVVTAAERAIRVVGVEPDAGDDHLRSRLEGRRVTIPVPRTIADGQQVEAPGELTWPINSSTVDSFVTVTDDEIIEAMRFALERMKIVVEPSGATALAALMTGAAGVERGATVGIVVSGGNIDAGRIAELLGDVTASDDPDSGNR